MRFEVPANELLKVGKSTRKQSPTESIAIIAAPPEDTARELNLVGFRTREAVGELAGFLDRAVRSGHASVRIIHGLGSGALRRAVTDYLSASPYCASFRVGEPGEGGAGVTVATLDQC
jgi:DNA mismatch repair protein MutS2